ncbi:hypothetical protein CSC42_2047 [Pseudomonas aeruginosa]|nr:hypothetical protein CSC42_2047 [Pseudomonas aeruginosa]
MVTALGKSDHFGRHREEASGKAWWREPQRNRAMLRELRG